MIVKTLRLKIPSGDAGADVTARALRQLIEFGKRDPRIRSTAVSILKSSDVPPYDRWAEVRALHGWVQKNVRYVQDPYQIEYVQTPDVMLSTLAGDCDDYTVLLGALLESVGYPIDIKIVGRDGRRAFHHVYPVVHLDGLEVALDASMPVPFGAQASDLRKQRIYRSELKGMRVTDVYGGSGLSTLRGFDKRQALRDRIGRLITRYRAEAQSSPGYLAQVMNADIDELKRRVNRKGMTEAGYKKSIEWFLSRVEAWKTVRPPSVTEPSGGIPAQMLTLVDKYTTQMIATGNLCLMSESQFVANFQRMGSAALSLLPESVRSALFAVLRERFAFEKGSCKTVVPPPPGNGSVPPPSVGGCTGIRWPDVVLQAGQKLTERCIRERIASGKIEAASGCALQVMPTVDPAIHTVVSIPKRATGDGEILPEVPVPSGVARCEWPHGAGPTVFQAGESLSGHCVKRFLDMGVYRPAEGCRLIYQGPVDPTRLPGPVGKVTCLPVGYDQPPEDYVPPEDYEPPYKEDRPYAPGTQPPTIVTVPGGYPDVKEAGFPTWAIVAIGAAVLLPMLLKGKGK